MQIEFTGRHTQVTEDLRDYTQEHFYKIARLLRNRFDVHVIVAAERHRRLAEITLKFRDHTLVGIDETADARTSIKGAIDKLERQVLRLLERRRTRKRRPSPTAAVLLNILGGARLDHRERQILETERIAIKPLTLEEAIDALESAHTGIVVFRNAETERVNVIYRRPDNNLALIEPEEA
jgi:ribosome hibernation promoting factor